MQFFCDRLPAIGKRLIKYILFRFSLHQDIESSAEGSKGAVDEMQISRLHMILKPFMLRRIKMDVENELSDKLEVLMYCPLTIRQKLLYMGLKRKIRIEDLLQGLGSQSQNSALCSSLMNLVMQFRKVRFENVHEFPALFFKI